jgi:thiol-disulfide isomerase/thioredoxin
VVSTALALLAAAAVAVVLSDGDDGDAGPPDPESSITLVPSDEVPSFDEATYTTFDGEEVPLADLVGTPTVVNFFASYCVPCITEMPAFEEVHQDLGPGAEVQFLGLAVSDRTADAEELVRDTGVTYPTAEDKDGSVIAALEGIVLPTTVLLDADGAVVARHNGELTADELRALLADELGIDP